MTWFASSAESDTMTLDVSRDFERIAAGTRNLLDP
jgi:hypothetical protein